ncbi:nitroreductase family protein [Paenibacillus wynnii]|uniref:nitroreductase family protein n=1 Tax=Paenibacillus wynnii TaxID=268407 RepID=UPI00278D82D7|nr:nitroreductase family protein [Paenibacillus wynnii]MDQ0192343.1 nitroreductase [Paenibacillus wynnii]
MGSSVIEIIEKRKSVRAYESTPIGPEVYNAVMDYLGQEENLTGPFGGKVNIEWIWAKGDNGGKGIKLGAYGLIQNPQAYLVGRIKNEKKALVEFGYVFHKLILFVTGLNLGTCWVGGTFNRNSFAREVHMEQDEIIPCITPVGYAREKQRFLDTTLRYVVKADNKKPWEELYYDSNFETKLAREEADALLTPLEMVRLGPSASNKQPWRLVLSEDRKSVHFYLIHTPNYSGNKLGFEMQRIDIGIAVCNFHLVCKELGTQGSWVMIDPQLKVKDQHTEYIASWMMV